MPHSPSRRAKKKEENVKHRHGTQSSPAFVPQSRTNDKQTFCISSLACTQQDSGQIAIAHATYARPQPLCTPLRLFPPFTGPHSPPTTPPKICASCVTRATQTRERTDKTSRHPKHSAQSGRTDLLRSATLHSCDHEQRRRMPGGSELAAHERERGGAV